MGCSGSNNRPFLRNVVSSFQSRPKFIALPATLGLKYVRGMKTECVHNEREVVAIVKLLDSTVIPYNLKLAMFAEFKSKTSRLHRKTHPSD